MLNCLIRAMLLTTGKKLIATCSYYCNQLESNRGIFGRHMGYYMITIYKKWESTIILPQVGIPESFKLSRKTSVV